MGQQERADDYSYTTALLANEINITAEGLRYYEEKGIGRPLKNEKGYRSYHPQEVVVLRLVRNLTAFGFSLREAIDLVTQDPFSFEAFSKALKEKKQQLEQKILDDKRVLECLDGILDTVANYDTDAPTRVWFEERQAFYYLEYFTGIQAYKDKELSDLMKKWMERMPIVYPMPVLKAKELARRPEDPFVSGGLAVNEEALPDPSFLDDRFCRFYPKRLYLCTVSRQENLCGVSVEEANMKECFRIMDLMNLKIDGDIFFQSVAANETKSEIVIYYKVFIPAATKG